jgi:hypothetical protein
MRSLRPVLIAATLAAVLPLATAAQDAGSNASPDLSYDKTFLTDYSLLKQRASDRGTEFVYIDPQAIDKVAKYSGVMVDQPEILISPDSPYKGAKPENLLSIANSMRDAMDARLTAGHYNVVDKPGPGIIYLRLALTDLEVQKKKRSLLEYTPIGAVVGFGVDAMKDFQKKFDILKMVFQAEITDSDTNAVYAQYVMVVGGGDKPVRIDFDKVKANMDEFGERLRCRLDNAQLPVDKRIDCLDPAARAARENAQPTT